MRDYRQQTAGLRGAAKGLREIDMPKTAEKMEDAADAIEELLAKVPTWISVEERLPEPEDMVLVATVHGGVYYGFLNHSGKFFTANNTLYDSWCWEPDVTHWMPLPEPPKGVE